MIKWIADQILAFFQRQCKHPSMLIACDILEGDAARLDIAVEYCGRCGAYRRNTPWRDEITTEWRRPDPNLWRGR